MNDIPDSHMPATALHILLGRVRSGWRRKVFLLFLLPPLFTCCYYLPQWRPIWPRREIPLLWLDRAIPFQPSWIFPYMSMYLLLPIPPLLAIRAPHVRRYTIGIALMFIIASVFFFAVPIAYPRPAIPESANVFYKHIASIDQPINSLPSLHAGLTIYTLLFARRALADLPPRRLARMLLAGWIWAALILYGTLATKQHYFVDLPAGAILAWAVHWIAWRGSAGSDDLAAEESALPAQRAI